MPRNRHREGRDAPPSDGANSRLERRPAQERLRPELARAFVANAFRHGRLETSGTAITEILPPTSRFSRGQGPSHEVVKKTVIERLTAYFERFFDLA